MIDFEKRVSMTSELNKGLSYKVVRVADIPSMTEEQKEEARAARRAMLQKRDEDLRQRISVDLIRYLMRGGHERGEPSKSDFKYAIHRATCVMDTVMQYLQDGNYEGAKDWLELEYAEWQKNFKWMSGM
jgi:hypothetical protein